MYSTTAQDSAQDRAINGIPQISAPQQSNQIVSENSNLTILSFIWQYLSKYRHDIHF